MCSSAAATASRRCGNDLGTTVMYLRKTTSGTAGNGQGTAINYLRGAAGNGRAQRSSFFDTQPALPRATAWAPRYMKTALR
jgi:membrane protein YqaA with SNARE-associated domain